METKREPIELKEKYQILLWYHLAHAPTPSCGIGERELIRQTGGNSESLRRFLYRLEAEGLIKSHFQQIDSGGTQDRFYKLQVPHKIMLVPQQSEEN